MQTMHTVLLVGSYDWNADLIPLEECETRLARIRNVMKQQDWDLLIIIGDSPEYSLLYYLTCFVPKLGPAMALIPVDGPITLLVSGSTTMMSSFERLTWVEDIRTFWDPGKTITAFLEDTSLAGKALSIGICGAENLGSAQYDSLTGGLGDKAVSADANPLLHTLTGRKSPLELELIGQASRILGESVDVLKASHQRQFAVVDSVLNAERAAMKAGAQDVRTLFSLDGGRTLQPFEHLESGHVDPLLAYIAVRYAGYWADGMVTLSVKQSEAHQLAADALAELVGLARPGVTAEQLYAATAHRIEPYRFHPVLNGAVGNPIGLSLNETPVFSKDSCCALEDGRAYTLRAGITDEEKGHALLSAMVVLENSASKVLWSAI